MFGLDPILLGFLFLITGLGLFSLTRSFLRLIPRIQPLPADPPLSSAILSLDIPKHADAVLILQSGGKILHVNEVLREWLNLPKQDLPNLEHLARQARPSEVFLSLCAAPGQARFSLQGLLVDGVSYPIPYQDSQAILLSLRRPDLTVLTQDNTAVSGRALDILTELVRTMTASLDLMDTLQAILESVERLIPSDISEITVWDPNQNLLIPYGFAGLPGVDRTLEKISPPYSPEEGYSGYIFTQRKPLRVTDVETFREARPAANRRNFPIRSFIGVPLLIAQEPIGTLELGSLTPDTFSENDQEVLSILSDQAAVALKNALVHQEEERRVAELTGLARLAQAVGTIRHARDLYSHLIRSIIPLLEVEILGFLIYEERTRTLKGQVPFIGIPDHFVALYTAEIPADSPAEKIWLSQQPILAVDAPTDPTFQALGLAHLAQAAGIQNSVLTPLAMGGYSLGYLQAANKKDATPFTDEELRILAIIAGQAAPIIQNANLIRETRRRAQQAEALRKIAALAASAATLDEILKYSLIEISRLLTSDSSAIFILDDEQRVLKIHQSSLLGLSPDDVAALLQLKMDDPLFQQTAAALQRIITFDPADGNLPTNHYLSIWNALHAQAMICVPLIVRERGIGEIILARHEDQPFSTADVELAFTAAGQIAGAIERASLYSQTDETLRRKVEQLTSLTRIGQELNASLDLKHLLKLVYNEALFNTGADCGSILLLNQEDTSADSLPDISAQIGDGLPDQFHQTDLAVLRSGQPLLIPDFAQSEFQPPHPGINTALIVPLARQDRLLGILNLHAHTPHRFDKEALEIAQALAAQAAIALGNAQRYHEQTHRNQHLEQGLEVLTKLLETNHALRASQPVEHALQTIAQAIQAATPFDQVLVSTYDESAQAFRPAAHASLSPDAAGQLPPQPIPWQQIQELARPEYQIAHSYFIPGGTSPPVRFPSPEASRPNGNAWRPDDVLFTPLFTNERTPLGLIHLNAPRNGLRPDRQTIETLEIFASQAALTIERYRHLADLQNKVETLEKEIARAYQASAQAQSQLPYLLQKDLEQTLSIQRLSQRSRRIQAILEVIEAVNKQTHRAALFQTLGAEFIARIGSDIVLIAEPAEQGPVLTLVEGKLPEGANPRALLGQRNPLRHSLRTNTPLFAANLTSAAAAEWQNSPLLTALKAESYFCLPIPSFAGNGRVEAAILALSHSPAAEFTPEDQQIFSLVAQQIAIALQNLALLEETERRLRELELLLDFSRQLGSLNPEEIMRSLVESTLRVITHAHLALVLLWDPVQQVLAPQAASGYKNRQRILEITYRKGEALPGRVFASGQPARVAQVDFARDYDLTRENLLRYQDATDGYLPISSMLIPIQAGETPLGVMVLDNLSATDAFSAEDQALITSLAQQTGLILENARLFQAAEQRALQLQTLAGVSTTITSNLQVDRIIASLLEQLKTVVPFETGTLWLRDQDDLTIRAAQGFEDDEERFGLRVAVEDSRLLKEMLTTGQAINIGNVKEDDRFPAEMEYPRLSWLGIPLLVKGEVIGVIALEKQEANFYSPENIQTATTFAAQAAIALENARLFEESAQRAEELNQRTQRLDLLNRLSVRFSGSLDPDNILHFTTEQLRLAINCAAVSALTVDAAGQTALVSEAPQRNGTAPQPLNAKALFDHLRETQGVLIASDLPNEPLLKPLQKFLRARKTQSLAALPLISGKELHGVLLIHAQTDRIPSHELELATTIANQAAIALGNARLFERTQTTLENLEVRERYQKSVAQAVVSLNQRGTKALPDVLAILGETSQASHVYYLEPEGDRDHLRWKFAAGWQNPSVPQPADPAILEQFPITLFPSLSGDIDESGIFSGQVKDLPPASRQILETQGIRSVLVLTVPGDWDRPSYLGVDEVAYERSWRADEIAALQTIAAALSSTIAQENLLRETQRLTEELEERVNQRTRELEIQHHRTQTLLRIITELSSSLDMDIVLNRTLEQINNIVDAEQSTIMLARPMDRYLLRRASVGYTTPTPVGGEVSQFSINEGLAGWVIATRASALIPNIHLDDRWLKPSEPTPEESPQHRSAIAVPLLMGEETLGALLLFHHEEDHFSPDHLDLVQATAKQIAVAINNAQLYSLIRDQAERLGSMLRSQQVEASRLRAILEAVADGVLVTDASGTISIFNSSGEQILGLTDAHIVGKPLEHFTGLFGKAGQLWIDTIRTWSDDTGTLESADVFSERITLDNGRVVAVSLAPVYTRTEFLGTVSIFRDITHQVEVDRLKSEFVATVSHELRTPMTPIRGYTDILLMGAAGPLTEQQASFLQIIKANTERLNILVNDLLDISRIEAGKISMSWQAVDLLGIVNHVVEEFTARSHEENKPIQITVEAPAFPLQVYGDPERIRQILENLLENAFNYTPENGRITIRFAELEDFIQIDIQDTGIGVDPSDQLRIFERFYRGEDPLVLSTSGTGLGLPIVQHMIERHGGKIWMESEGIPGRGSTFSFTLPVYRPEA